LLKNGRSGMHRLNRNILVQFNGRVTDPDSDKSGMIINKGKSCKIEEMCVSTDDPRHASYMVTI
jgi:hypothetical protein